MKLLTSILLFSFINHISSLTVSKVEGIVSNVESVNVDSDGNIYVAGIYATTQIQKLSPSKEILWTVDLPSNVLLVESIHINREGDVYLHLVDNKYSDLFAILKKGSTIMQTVESIGYDLFFMDDNDNLFYAADGGRGLRAFRHNSNDSVAIKNLEDVTFLSNEDLVLGAVTGNIYTGVENNVAIITQESLQMETPSAEFFPLSEDLNDGAQHLTFDKNGDLWFTLADPIHFKGSVGRYENGTLKKILVDKRHWVPNLFAAKDNVVVIAPDFLDRENSSAIYYVTNNDDVIEIPELMNLSFDHLSTGGIADSEGNAYIFTAEEISPSLGSMILIKPDEMKPVPVQFEFSNGGVLFLKLDFDEDVWIVTSDQGLHYLKKKEVVAEKVDLPERCNKYLGVIQAFFINSLANEIYVGCPDGLYVVAKN